jgi:hypothetical protein
MPPNLKAKVSFLSISHKYVVKGTSPSAEMRSVKSQIRASYAEFAIHIFVGSIDPAQLLGESTCQFSQIAKPQIYMD